MLLTEQRVRNAARTVTAKLQKSASAVLTENGRTAKVSFDIFLSHSTKDSELVLGAQAILENEFSLSVYIDWITDPALDRSHVTPATAAVLRTRMSQCDALLYLKTENSTDSTWMPWELGYFDALKGKVGILPVTKTSQQTYDGNEYLGLYPYVDASTAKNTSREYLWINKSSTNYAPISRWFAS